MPVVTRSISGLSELETSNSLGVEGKALITAIRNEFQSFKEELTNIVNAKNEVISLLQSEVNSLRKEVEEANAYSRRDCAIINGEALPPCTGTDENTGLLIAKALKDKLKISITENDLSVAHRLGPIPPGPGADGRKVIVKFVRRETKNYVMKAAKLNRNAGVYVNDCLTPLKRSLFYTARKMKRTNANVIKGCSTFDGKVFIYTAGSTSGSRDIRHLIDSRESLAKFCRDYLKKELDLFLESWQR